MKRLFVIIMPIGRENINMDFCFENAINKSMLLCDFTAPSTFGLSFQRFRVAQSCLGMIVKFAYKPKSFFVRLRLIAQKILQVCLSLLLDDDLILAHKLRIYLSSSSTLSKLFPGCFSARSILVKNSSSVINEESSFYPLL